MNKSECKQWKVEITFRVSNNWVEDGFDLSKRIESIIEFFKGLLPYAFDYETEITVAVKEK